MSLFSPEIGQGSDEVGMGNRTGIGKSEKSDKSDKVVILSNPCPILSSVGMVDRLPIDFTVVFLCSHSGSRDP